MNRLRHALQSCALTFVLSALAVLSVIGTVLGVTFLSRWLPGITVLSLHIFEATLSILDTFGDGHCIQGSLVIAIACGFAISAFDLFAPSRYQHLN